MGGGSNELSVGQNVTQFKHWLNNAKFLLKKSSYFKAKNYATYVAELSPRRYSQTQFQSGNSSELK
jgi:hypothetical protein